MTKFSGVHCLDLHFPSNFGADSTQIHFIGFKGEFTEVEFLVLPQEQACVLCLVTAKWQQSQIAPCSLCSALSNSIVRIGVICPTKLAFTALGLPSPHVVLLQTPVSCICLTGLCIPSWSMGIVLSTCDLHSTLLICSWPCNCF